jgi:hypothetical protein
MPYPSLAAALPGRPRRIRFQGLDLDTATCFQRYCPLRGSYVVQSRADPFLCLESPRLPELVLRGVER